MAKQFDTTEAVKEMAKIVDDSLTVVREVFKTRDYLKINIKTSSGFARKKSEKVYEEVT